MFFVILKWNKTSFPCVRKKTIQIAIFRKQKIISKCILELKVLLRGSNEI